MNNKIIKNNFLVVSDYNWLPDKIEDSWVHNYTDNYLIYDKANRFQESLKVKRQLNVGQNIYDMLYFIITHYDILPEVTIFCRAALFFPKGRERPLSNGNISEENFLKKVNNNTFTELHDYGQEVHNNGGYSLLGPDNSFLETNDSWYFNHVPGGKYYTNLNTFFSDVYENPEYPKYIRFSPGANYIIPKENILKYSKNFYEQLIKLVSYDKVVSEAHMLERALYTIFTCNYIVKEKYK